MEIRRYEECISPTKLNADRMRPGYRSPAIQTTGLPQITCKTHPPYSESPALLLSLPISQNHHLGNQALCPIHGEASRQGLPSNYHYLREPKSVLHNAPLYGGPLQAAISVEACGQVEAKEYSKSGYRDQSRQGHRWPDRGRH
ncbi:hypothetical protein M0R45_011038 [Rubus argutus]|uniref:Uncharacterized protein n=1 Tax=Rubus argutus TaxID=59490 RepID=A0AAW1YBV5_RUBAR